MTRSSQNDPGGYTWRVYKTVSKDLNPDKSESVDVEHIPEPDENCELPALRNDTVIDILVFVLIHELECQLSLPRSSQTT